MNKKILYTGVGIASVVAATLILTKTTNENETIPENTSHTQTEKKSMNLDFVNKNANDMRSYYTDEGQEFLKKILPDSVSSDLALLNIGKTLENELKNLKFKTVDNTEIKLKDLKGSKILLDFALKDCSTCQSELTFLSNYNFKKDDIVYLHVFPRDATSDIKKVFDDFNAKFKESSIVSTTGSNGFEFEDLNITNVPAKIFIDENGVVQYAFVGAIKDKETLDLNINRAFNKETPKLLDYLK